MPQGQLAKAEKPPLERARGGPRANRTAVFVVAGYYLLSALAVCVLPPARWTLLPGLLAGFQARRSGGINSVTARRPFWARASMGCGFPHYIASTRRIFIIAP